MIEESETDTLLGASQTSPTDHSQQLQTQSTTTVCGVSKPTSSHAFRVIIIASLVLLITDFAGYASFAPQLDIYEGIICRQYYAHLNNSTLLVDFFDEQRCKIAAVQSELALINGWSDTFPQIPGEQKQIMLCLMLTTQEFFWLYRMVR